MPSKDRQKRKKNRDRRSADSNPNCSLQSTDQDVQPEHSDQNLDLGTPNCSLQSNIFDNPLQGGESSSISSLPSSSHHHSLHFNFENVNISDTLDLGPPHTPTTPLTPFSLTSEAVAPRKQRKTRESSVDTESLISSLDSASIFSSRGSSPSISGKNKGGRPKKQTRKNAGRKPKIIPQQPQVPLVPSINFENLPLLNFVTQQTNDPGAICNRAFMALRDNERAPLRIETLWNNLTEWFDGSEIYGFLCYLTRHCHRYTVVVDSNVIIPAPMNNNVEDIPEEIFVDRCYGFIPGQVPEIILFPIAFPNHWTLVVWDASDNRGFFIDSLSSPLQSRLHGDERIPIITSFINRMTNIPIDNIHINDYPFNSYTRQNDGNSCGYFTCLYAEAWLFNNRNLLFNNLNINTEKRRILWHVNNLFNGDNFEYHFRLPHVIEHVAPPQHVIEHVIPDEGVVVPNYPFVFLEPDPPSKNLRRSERIKSKKDATPANSSLTSPPPSSLSNPITSRCTRNHPLWPCADVRSQHTTDYYDSGNLGDSICNYCWALLFNSEVNKEHKNKFKRVTSSFCCKCGKVTLPAYTEHPPLLKNLLRSDTPQSKEFLKNENIYNSLLAFASISVGHQDSSHHGSVCFMLNGEFSRRISSMFPGPLTPSFSQLYILDANEALDIRTKNTQYGGDRVNKKTLQDLDTLLRTTHPFARNYINFHTQYERILQQDGPDAVSKFRFTLLEERNVPAPIRDRTAHPRQVNLPDEKAMFSIWTESTDPPLLKGVYITDLQGSLFEIKPYNPIVDTLTYPLLFPNGDDGFHEKFPFNTNKIPPKSVKNHSEDSGSDDELEETPTSKKYISFRDYIRYRLAIRKDEPLHNIWSAGGGLSQKFTLDYAARIDAQVASFLRQPQFNLLKTIPPTILKHLANDGRLKSVDDITSVVFFRKYHPGTRPYFQDMFYDATTIMSRTRRKGCASFMLTFTSNPNWPEIKRNFLHKNQKLVDRFDVMCRVYEDKKRKLTDLINNKNILGKILGSAQSREFQKRIGGPHLHRVYTTDLEATPENISNIIWAHIPPNPPDSDTSDWANFLRKVRDLLPKFQVHDCGSHCRGHDGRCMKHFPKAFCRQTIIHANRPAEYYRPSPEDGGEVLSVPRGRAVIKYDNSRIVPYNPFIMVMFQSHHNLELAYGQTDNLKYALKYPFKGPSFSYIKNTAGTINIDEPAQYAKMLYRSPAEAFSRIQSYKYADLSHAVIPLSIHLPGNQPVFMTPASRNQIIADVGQGKYPESKLTAYWKLWAKDNNVKNILFENLPETYAFHDDTKTWEPRKYKTVKGQPVLGRIYTVSPRADPEKFALYVLTKHFPGDPDHLLTVNGIKYTTFAEAARQRGLFEDSSVWERTLREGSYSLTPSQMRQLFVNILVFSSTDDCVIDALHLWNMFIDHFFDRRCTEDQRPIRIDRALAIIERYLLANGKSMSDYGLPLPHNSLTDDPDTAVDQFFFPQHINDDDTDATADTSSLVSATLNPEQNNFFDLIVNSIRDPNSAKLYFLSGDGGTGKTFLLNYLLFHLRRLGHKVLATASTGIAATKFYAGGMTLHSAFRFGINHRPGQIPQIQFGSYFGRRIIESDVVIIDEITLLEMTLLENVDLLCRTMVPSKRDIPFAGKVVILSGDWKQSLPVVKNCSIPEMAVPVCIQSSYLYKMFLKTRLMQNMRLQPSEIQFKEWLYNLGINTSGDKIALPKSMMVETRDELISFVFDQGFTIHSSQLLTRLMLAPTNRSVDLNNDLILASFNSQSRDYYSVDRSLTDDPLDPYAAQQDVSYINNLTPSGLPAHHLHLKVGSVIVLLINLNTSKGLCNGTRLKIIALRDHLIEAETIYGVNQGVTVGLSRVRMQHQDPEPDGVSFVRLQFPVRTAFCMTITKAQGQTCERLGIDFSDEPFAHGQLYTALSRCTNSNFIRVFAPNKPKDNDGNTLITNVVARGLQFD
uniref:ATP-dependent DNA helicase n=7 Tax=Meloidogyne TaxID=189290 RepID=A0A6V7X645_MELEN|nr:unnamed protein product [Meloidogyne enterolobii]CAD2208164.1 unnamed protein product [Meloidogyne enterolobii]